jgi:hypothetical protein
MNVEKERERKKERKRERRAPRQVYVKEDFGT